KYETLEPLFPGFDRDGQRTFYGLQTSVEGKFSHDDKFIKIVQGLDLSGSCQNSDGEGQIVGRTFLSHIGWRHVDNDFLPGKFVARVLQGCGNPETAFLYGFVGKTH